MSNRDAMVERFLKYVKFDTQASHEATVTPSSPGQMDLAKVVLEDLKAAGVSELELTDEAYIYGSIPGNLADNSKVPTLGFLAHLDTAAEAPGKDVKPRIIENYQGGEITYPDNPNVELCDKNAPALKNCVGQTIITTDGNTLLGADNKVGITVIVALAKHLTSSPNLKHGNIRIGIMPDEEIGIGAEKLDIKKFGADVAYTIDGESRGDIDVESFNGYKGSIKVGGCVAFPGYGKGIYLNATQVLAKFISKMPDKLWPQNAEGREDTWWLSSCKGDTAHAETEIFLRSFDIEGIEKQKQMLDSIKQDVLKEFPEAVININIQEVYKNYKLKLEEDPRIVAFAEEAMKNIGITPTKKYIRGGCDCCHLCFNGLLSTNIFCGFHNMHSLTEWVTIEDMEASFKTALELTKIWATKA